MDRSQEIGPTAVTIAERGPLPAVRAPDDEYVSWELVTGIVRRRWLTMIAAVTVALALAGVYLFRATPVYESSASLLVEPAEYNLPELVKSPFTDNELGTQMEMLKNQQLGDRIVGALNLRVAVVSPRVPRSTLFSEIAVEDSANSTEIKLKRVGPNLFTATDRHAGRTADSIAVGAPARLSGVTFTLAPAADDYSSIDLEVKSQLAAIRDLAQSIKIVRPDRSGNVITISHRDPDPVLAGRIPDLMATYHVSDRVAAARAKVQTAVDFLASQSDSLHQELFLSENALNAFRQREGIVSLPNEALSQVTQSGEIRATRARLDAERMALQNLVSQADSNSQGGSSPYRKLTAFPTLINNPVVSNLVTTLNTLENQRSDLLLRRTVADPDAVASQKRIAEVDGQLRGLTLTYLAGLRNQVAGLDQALQGYASSAARMPSKSMQDERLSRKPKLLADVYALVQTRLQEARIAEGAIKPGVSVIDRAGIPELPVWPRPALVLALGLALGLILGAAVAWIRESMDDAIHSRADVVRATSSRVLGVVPHIRKIQRATPRRGRAPALWHPDQRLTRSDLSAMEAYNWLGASLSLSQADRTIGVIAFTSPLAREGKTLSAANFALSGCRRGRRVLLIDADLRRGRVHEVFGTRRSPGLAEVLAGSLEAGSAILQIPAGMGATIHVMPAGSCVDHPAALLGSAAMRELLDALRERYDLVVNDTPPVNLVSDSLLLAQHVDGVVLVARAGVTEGQALTEASRHIREAGAPLLGVLLNDIDLERDGRYDDYRYLEQAGEYAVASNA